MKDLFLQVFEISLSTSAVVLVLLLLSTVLNRRYAAKWKYGIWILLALRLAIPMQISLPQKQVVLDVPTRITAPITIPAAAPVETPVPVEGIAQPVVPEASPVSISLLDVIAVIWLAGAAVYMAVHLAAYWRYKRKVLHNCTKVTDLSILQQVRSIAKELGLRDRIPVIRDPAAGSPLVLGFFRPVLVLPDTAYQPLELYFVLKHELVHMKRHDVFAKLLFVFATAIHWFNPLAYLMQKEAVVDMELSCDERVVKGTVYETRKAYTETLLSTMCRQYQKSTALSTEFYGGKEIMKKRFRNILNRAKKRNGILILVIILTAVAILGALIGVSPSSGDGVEESIRMLEVAAPFCNAYAKGDLDTMRLYLADTYDGNLEIEEVTDLEGSIGLQGNPMPGDLSVNADDEHSVTGTNAPLGSTFSAYAHRSDIPKPVDTLWLRFIKQEDGWKIQDYALADYQRVSIAASMEGLTPREEAAQVALNLAVARFNNDMDGYLPYTSYDWQGIIFDVNFDKMPDPSQLKVREIRQPGDVDLSSKTIPLGSTTTMAIDVQDVNDSDTFIVCLIRQENGWRAYDFGFEKSHHFDRGEMKDAESSWTAVMSEDSYSESVPADQLQSDFYPNANELDAALEVSWEFSRACLRGDTSTMKPLLADSFQGTPQTYLFKSGLMSDSLEMVLTNHANYRLISSDPDNIYGEPISIGCRLTLAMLLKDDAHELLLTLIKQADGWKVEEYSLVQEGFNGEPRQKENSAADTQEIKTIGSTAVKFALAYFGGDLETVKSLIGFSFCEPSIYEGPEIQFGKVFDEQIHFAPQVGDLSIYSGDEPSVFSASVPQGSHITVAFEFNEGYAVEGADYFSVSLWKLEEGWKVSEYGFAKRGPVATAEDSAQIKKIANEFIVAYFSGNDEAMEKHMVLPQHWMNAGSYAGKLTKLNGLKGLPREGEALRDDGSIDVSAEYLDEESPDSYNYLTMHFVKQDGDWKIEWYAGEK